MSGDWGSPQQPYPQQPYPPQGYVPQPYPPAPILETEPLEYHLVHRGGALGWWRPLVGVLVAILLVFVVFPIVFLLVFMVGFALAGLDPVTEGQALGDVTHPTPVMLAYINLTLASAIPTVWFLNRVLHGLKPRWLASVRPRIRWSYLLVCLGLSVIALLATVAVGSVLPGAAATGDGGQLNDFTSTVRDYLLVVVLLTPLQAAGEEYFFRGYLTQAVGGLVGRAAPMVSRTAAVLVPALLFGLAHGLGQSVPVFFDRFAFGVVAGVLVILTGGLEAGIAMHVLNNFLAFGFALAFSDMATALNPPAGSWWDIIPTLTQSLVYLALATWAARKLGLGTRTDPSVLAASRGHVYRFPPAQPPASLQ